MATTREIIAAEYERAPSQTLQQVGDVAGVTRERVRQIVKEDGIVIDRAARPKACKYCGDKHFVAEMNKAQVCQPCQGRIAKWKEYTRDKEVPCTWCGSLFYKSASQYRRSMGITARSVTSGAPSYKGRFFCDRVCFGKWFGFTSGFTAHPENIIKGQEARRKNKEKKRKGITK
jgi:DNA-directed RNA polymerase subunit RPC12/RpoP